MNIYDETKWCVHISGPDNVLAANNFLEAVEQCERINREILIVMPSANTIYHPVVWAKVEKWYDVADGEHQPSETNWENYC